MVRSDHANPSLARFVISLDFELFWGVRDKRTIAGYRDNLLGVRQAVPALLSLFAEFDIHATWATVGFLCFDGRDDLLANLPTVFPRYADARYSPYASLDKLGSSETDDPFHFAPSLVRKIAETPGQELGTHTFSHFYCLEPGNNEEAFEADLVAAQRAADRFGVKLRSIVFPRNQVNPHYLPTCAKLGIRAYRGTPLSRFYVPRANSEERLLVRAGRLLDNYLPVAGHHSFRHPASRVAAPHDIRASFFLRPHSRQLSWLEPVRRRRIFDDLSFAARHQRTYHLWWHPHNFGTNLGANLAFLREVLTHFSKLREAYGMESVNMAELATQYDRQAPHAA